MTDADSSLGSNRIIAHPILGEDARRETVRLVLDGRSITALEGDIIAAALRAFGIEAKRSMPDSGAPRGAFCGVGRCPDCMMTVDGILNVQTCVTLVRDGMALETQHGPGIQNGVVDEED